MVDYDPTWIITEPVMVTRINGPDYRIRVRDVEPDASGVYRECELRFADGELTFDAVRIEVGDDFMAYLAVMDEAGDAEPGEWVRSEPYPDDDHDCPRQRFLDDPITQAYGVGSEMVSLISCPVCEARAEQRP